MKIKSSLDNYFNKYKIYKRLKEDYSFRTLFLMLVGAFFNFLFALFNAFIALKYKSIWYGAFAFYYTVLAIQRILVMFVYSVVKKSKRKKDLEREKLKIYLANGAIFIPLDLALSVVVFLMIFSEKTTPKGEIMAITVATYAFYKITMAIINIFKARAKNDFLIQTIRNIALVDALTSILSLEMTLISTFGEVNQSMLIIITISGFSVCLFTICLGIFMIVKAIKKLKS